MLQTPSTKSIENDYAKQVLGALQRMKVRQLEWDPGKWQTERIDSPMLAAIATHMLSLSLSDGHADILASHQAGWAQIVLARADSEGAASSLHEWVRPMLTAPAPQPRLAVLRWLDLEHLQRWRAEVDANLKGEDADCAIAAALLLHRHELLGDLEPLLRSAQTRVREFAVQELAVRKQHQYPPYQRMARVIVRGENAEKAGAFADLPAPPG